MNVVISGSMEPLMYRGDIFVVEKADFFGIHEFNSSDLEIGDIVVYRADWGENSTVRNVDVIHRIINISEVNGEKYYTIKGDNNPVQDPYLVKPSQVQSKLIKLDNYWLIIPKIGYVTIGLKGL